MEFIAAVRAELDNRAGLDLASLSQFTRNVPTKTKLFELLKSSDCPTGGELVGIPPNHCHPGTRCIYAKTFVYAIEHGRDVSPSELSCMARQLADAFVKRAATLVTEENSCVFVPAGHPVCIAVTGCVTEREPTVCTTKISATIAVLEPDDEK